MEQDFSPRCSKCRERAVSLATVPYHAVIENDGRQYELDISDLVVPRCEKCGNYVLHDDANRRITAGLRKVVGLLAPDEIRFHRERLGLSQDELAHHLGITTSTLMGWEAGALIQPRSLDRFLRAILTMPDLRKNLADEHALELSSAT
jgi:putative zinc finger/helix-turn-helix YgiT family protein